MNVQLFLEILVYTVFQMFIVEMMRKHYRFARWFWLGSLLTFPIWIFGGGVSGWFRWAKILSVIIPTIFVGYCRVSNYEKRTGPLWAALQKNWTLWVLYGVLFLNIAEATIKDVTLSNYANALVGLILCITIPFPPKYWEYSKEKFGDLIVYTNVMWNFVYTTWNACFVYGESPIYFASSLSILLAAELYPIIKGRPELYIMSRVYTLAAHLVLRACFSNYFVVNMNSEGWFHSEAQKYWGLINALLAVPFVFWYVWQLHTGNANYSFRRIKQAEN